ncbi:hypothetical protein PIB30_089186 [Stylosanthes scabra]|uniref:Uncharacterized protein n=1 Tax=Stylosanthes scabra TaxID=79078 RepID=A0ABU6TTI5_9FABA|nr:hypothetical protein [Stylosanthes scabra]
MREAQKRTESQLNHLAKLLQKFANQPPINPQVQAQPSAPSPLPSQPLPNPKGDINAVQVEIDNERENEAEDKEGENDWLYELLTELANSSESDDEKENENIEEESKEESDEEEEESELAEEEDINDMDKGNIFFINTLFKEKKSEEEIPIKCEDPSPCLVTCKIRGVSILDCLCDPGACGNIMPFEAEFKLIYYDEIFTFSIGNVIEIFHLMPLPKPPKKRIQQLKMGNAEIQKESPGRKAKMRKTPRGIISNKKGTRNAPTQSKGKKKKVSLNTKEKKKEPNEGSTQKKRTLKCLSFDGLLGKLKVLKDVLCRNKNMDAHLVKNNSKWK